MEYIHSSLPPNCFRLLCVERSSDDSNTLQCSLQIVSFNNPPTYHCLSYTWGNPFTEGLPQFEHYAARDAARKGVSSSHIICDGRRLDIGQNLLDALSTLCDVASRELKSFWVDAICINQKDLIERGNQVARMADIYRNADSVIPWLGPEDEHTPKVLEAADILQQSYGPSEEIFKRYLNENNVQLASNVSVQQLEAIIMFLSRSWFSRLWILQEVCLARDIRLFCGRVEFTWYNMTHLMLYLSSTVGKPILQNDGKMKYLGLEDEYHEQIQRCVNLPSICTLKILTEESGPVGFCSYEHRVYSMIRAQFLCSDPRDLIYGLRGLCDPVLFQEPDYGKSVEAVFTELATLSIEFNQDLRILKFVEDSSSRKIKSLPSWVPDCTAKVHLGNLQHPYAHRSLSRDAPAPAFKEEILIIPAIKIENVTQPLPGIAERGLLDLELFLGIVASFSGTYPTHENILDVLVIVLTAYERNTFPTLDSSKIDYHTMFFDFVQYNLVQNLIFKRDLPGSQTHIKSLYEALRKFDREDTPILPQWSQIESKFYFYDDVLGQPSWQGHAAQLFTSATCHGQIFASSVSRIFRTNGNYMGIGRPSIQLGDEIWLTPHSNTPLILRPLPARGDNIYEFVGEAYVHGISHGEVVENDPVKFQRIQIA
jgi:hypothetical protein